MNVIYIIFIGLLFSCQINSGSKRMYKDKNSINNTTYNNLVIKSSMKKQYDTTLYPFNSDSIYITVSIYNPKEENPRQKNTVVNVINLRGTIKSIVFSDSVFCKHMDIHMQDINGDKQRDLLLLFDNGARSNPSYHLYVLRSPAYIKRIVGFENLPNIDYDSDNNIILSDALAGLERICRFSRVDKYDSLIELFPPITLIGDDSLNYSLILKKINLNTHEN